MTLTLQNLKKCVFSSLNRNFAVSLQVETIWYMETSTQLVETIKKGIQEKKGSNIVVADLQGIDGAICHYFVICQGNSPAQVEAIADSVGEFARKGTGKCPMGGYGLYGRDGTHLSARRTRVL